MQKLSDAIYASLFWLISGLIVWLVILPGALICFPVILMVRVVKPVMLKIPASNIAEAEKKFQTSSQSRQANSVESFLSSLALTTLVEVPAVLAAIISLQPTRLIKKELRHAQILQPQPAKARDEASTDTVDVSSEEKSDRLL